VTPIWPEHREQFDHKQVSAQSAGMRVSKTLLAAWLGICTSCAAAPTASVPAAFVERQAVADGISRFVGAISAHDFAAATELFAADAVWSSSAGALSFRHEGRAAILDFLTHSDENVQVLHYSAGVPDVTLLGDGRAQSRVGLVEVLHIKATGERKLLLGTYVDQLAKTEGVWRFSHRHATINHAETLRDGPPP
jgi:ketosteroid isomerase-like protein